MLQICKQTYLYTALKIALQDLGLQSHSQSLQTTLLTLLQTKFEAILNKEKEKKQENKKPQAFNAQQILQSQFPLGNQSQNSMKYSSILYNMEMPKTIDSKFKLKKNKICILECYSDQNIKDKGKDINKNTSTGTVNTAKTAIQLQKMKEKQEHYKKFAQIKSTVQKMIKAQSQRQKQKIKERKILLGKRKRSTKKNQKSMAKTQRNSSLNKSLVRKKKQK